MIDWAIAVMLVANSRLLPVVRVREPNGDGEKNVSQRTTERDSDEGSGGKEYWREQIEDLLRDANLPPPPAGMARVEEPSADELRASNLLERAIGAIVDMAQSQVAYAANVLRLASVVDEDETAENGHHALAALKSGRFLREICVSEYNAAARRLELKREVSRELAETQELLNELEEEQREDPDYVPSNSGPISTEEDLEADQREIADLEEIVEDLASLVRSLDLLVERVRALHPQAAEVFDRDDRTGSVT